MTTLALPHPEDGQSQRDVEFVRTILNVLFKWKWFLLVCFVAVLIPIVVTTLFKTREYQVTTKIMLSNARAQTSLSSTGLEELTTNRPVSAQTIKSEIEILTSQDLVRQAVEKSDYPLADGNDALSAAQQERALQALRARIDVNAIPNSSVFSVSFRDQDPHQAAHFLNTLIALYLERHSEVHGGSSRAAAFFEEQAKTYAAELEKSREALKGYQEENDIYDIRDEMEIQLKKVATLQGQRGNIAVQIKSIEEQIRVLTQQINQEPDQIPMQHAMVMNPEVASLTAKLFDLERQRDELLQRYTPQSRFIIEKENEIATLREKLDGKERLVVGDTIIAANRTKESLIRQLTEKRAELAALKIRQADVLRDIGPAEERLAHLKAHTFTQGQLRKEFDVARSTYYLYLQKAQEARIASTMDAEKLTNVQVIQNATPPAFPVGRGLMRALIVAAIAGLSLGIGGAFLLEFFNITVKSEEDIERFLEIPVLATIPQLSYAESMTDMHAPSLQEA